MASIYFFIADKKPFFGKADSAAALRQYLPYSAAAAAAAGTPPPTSSGGNSHSVHSPSKNSFDTSGSVAVDQLKQFSPIYTCIDKGQKIHKKTI